MRDPPWFDQFINVWGRVEIMKLVIMPFSPLQIVLERHVVGRIKLLYYFQSTHNSQNKEPCYFMSVFSQENTDMK
jgi:hypothetical protein